MQWIDFADKEDIRARRFYEELLDEKAMAYGAWLKVPKKIAANCLRRQFTSGLADHLWTGTDWVDVDTYDRGDRMFARIAS